LDVDSIQLITILVYKTLIINSLKYWGWSLFAFRQGVCRIINTQFLESNRYNDNEVAIFKEKNYYLIAGYILDLNSSIKFKPALLTKMVGEHHYK
jgi:hypothetical protein